MLYHPPVRSLLRERFGCRGIAPRCWVGPQGRCRSSRLGSTSRISSENKPPASRRDGKPVRDVAAGPVVQSPPRV